MNVAIHITGSRGDVQPFLVLSQLLQKPPYSHRVRISTHPDFKAFVEDNGLDFFSIGGDPTKLMAFMVKNPGIIPREQLEVYEKQLTGLMCWIVRNVVAIQLFIFWIHPWALRALRGANTCHVALASNTVQTWL